jgi:hypothetical protein
MNSHVLTILWHMKPGGSIPQFTKAHQESTYLLPVFYIELGNVIVKRKQKVMNSHFLTNYMTYETQRFNTAFTSTHQKSLPESNQSQLHNLTPISLRSILLLSSHLY